MKDRAKLILLHIWDEVGDSFVDIILLNNSGRDLTNLIQEWQVARPGEFGESEDDETFNHFFSQWACEAGYCELVDWEER